MSHRFRRLSVVVGFCLLSISVLALLSRADDDAPTGRKSALLVGVKRYPQGGGLGNLKHTENDVTDLAALLKDRCGFKNVVLMTHVSGSDNPDLLPTAENIRENLKSLLEGRRHGDTILVAFSGHGVQLRVDGRDESFFCPTDARLSDRTTLVALSEVYKQLEGCPADVKLLLADCCRNDLEGKGAADRPDVDPPEPPKGVAALFSCSKGQRSFESDEFKQGVFFHYVIEGLKGAAANKRGEVTLASLSDYVQEEVPDRVKLETSPRVRQIPNLVGDVSGKLTLAKVDAGATPTPPPVTVTEDKPGKEIQNSIGMKLALIPRGTFTMGSPKDEAERGEDEGPQHEVEISQPFYLGVYAVTQAEYQKVVGDNPSYFSAGGGGKDKVAGLDTTRFPVETVSPYDAMAYCAKLSALEAEKKAGRTYRLPTEAEWEYACRAGTQTPFYFGDKATSKEANFDGNYPYGGEDKGPFLERPAPVGSYAKNAFGLYDMHGNVWQWCADWYSEDYYKNSPNKDPHGPTKGVLRVLRGGSWGFYGRTCRAAVRYRYVSDTSRDNDCGFRVVCIARGTP